MFKTAFFSGDHPILKTTDWFYCDVSSREGSLYWNPIRIMV